jgi:ankyrin repeat protein
MLGGGNGSKLTATSENSKKPKQKKWGLLSGRQKQKDYGKKLMKLAQQHRWDKLEKFLMAADYNVKESIKETKDDFGGNCVHILCLFDAPLDLFIQVVDLCPSKVREVDNENRTPLFMAAASGASAAIVSSLLALYPEAATMRDLDGRTPLIAACMHQDPGAIMRDGQSSRYRQFRIVQELIAATPNGVDLSDLNGLNALEYAILGSGELCTVIVLQKAVAIDQRIRAEWNDSKRRTRLPSIVSPSDPPKQNETDSTLPHNPLQWDCYKISRSFERRNAHRMDDILPRFLDMERKGIRCREPFNEFRNGAVMQFIGMPGEENMVDEVIFIAKVKEFKVWQTICRAYEPREQTQLNAVKPIIIDLMDDNSSISDISAPI